MDFPLGPYQPDRGQSSAPMLVADGVLPKVDGYGPFPSLYTPSTATALPGAPRGIFSVVLSDGSWEAFGLTASDFYMLGSNYIWGASIQGGYACPSGYDWSFLHFGTKLLFTNTVDGLQSYDVQTPGVVSTITAAGKPAWIFTCANFVIALNCLDSLGNRDNRLIKTSGFNDQTNWVTDGADYQELADGQALLCGFDLKQNTALLIQQAALVVMQFGNASGGAQFSLQKVADGRGAVGAKSCIGFDGMVFGLDLIGFFRFDLSNGLQYIGAEEVDTTFLASIDKTAFANVQASVDPERKVVLWRYKRTIDTSTTVNEVCIGYEWNQKRWFTVTDQTSYLTRLATVAVTYDAATGTYDSQTLTYDDLSLTGAAPLFGALDENYKYALWTGPSLAATMTGGLLSNGARRKVLWATPITDAAAPTLNLGVKDDLTDTTSWQGAESKTEGGRVPSEGAGLFFQFSLAVPYGDTWTYAKGIDSLVFGSGGGPK